MKPKNQILRTLFFLTSLKFILFLTPEFAFTEVPMKELETNFKTPPIDCMPHTRWWWPGNPVTKEEITWQMEGMKAHGIGGVEQITMGQFYQKGNVPYLSDEFIDILKHTVATAKRLGMEVSLNFGGPGWIIGGEWVPQSDRAKDMAPTSMDLVGPETYCGGLPTKLRKTSRSWEHYKSHLDGTEKLLAVVAGKIIDNRIDKRTLTVLTEQVKNNKLEWQIPEGHWRLMAFWLKFSEIGTAVDHFDKAAMQRYCDYLGGKFYDAFGQEFGKTLDSFFCDSFELGNTSSGIYWSTGLLDEFQKFKGYDLAPYLPAIWWEVSEISPKIRYDVNHFLHHIGLEAFFKTFLDWCEAHGVKGRIQPYGFTTDNIEGAGLTHIPEMEITAGEKDAVPWFDTRIGPKKYVSSGAHLYGRTVVTTEAYTFMHWELYRSTLEELKIASDNYLRAGANKFYNHGYSYSPERDIAPSRTIGFAALINHHNIWWKYYPLLAQYVARCCYLLRQGEFAPDIAVYSPLANQWTLSVLNARKWTREFYWGDLARYLIANGYDFDLLNDDALQRLAKIEDGKIKIRQMEYKVLILPNVKALPLETLKFIQSYVRQGGIVIALERIPDSSVGMADYQNQDAAVKAIANELFPEPRGRYGVGHLKYGSGHSYNMDFVINRQDVLDWHASALDPFVNTIRKHLPPDLDIDFIDEGLRENKGLTFMHRKLDNADIYFVTNIQEQQAELPVTFRVQGKRPWQWNPYNGDISPVHTFRDTNTGIEIPIRLAPYESIFFIFNDSNREQHIEQSNFYEIATVAPDKIEALAHENGTYQAVLKTGERSKAYAVEVTDVPASLLITGEWRVKFEAHYFPKIEKWMQQLHSWTKDSDTKHFSGTACYEISFNLPHEFQAENVQLLLELGKVGNIAEVTLNGIAAGTAWMRAQKLDITGAAQTGNNTLKVLVTNTLINRVSGLKVLPPVPDELVPRFGVDNTPISSLGRSAVGFKPLPASGLLGPVKILAFKKIEIAVK
ncbi:hypothetical protein JXJ21_07110 [candidate division KSB1 bacterium]|nr:hypothetical protein [candidate division KSB1 bacterium]